MKRKPQCNAARHISTEPSRISLNIKFPRLSNSISRFITRRRCVKTRETPETASDFKRFHRHAPRRRTTVEYGARADCLSQAPRGIKPLTRFSLRH
jgi:hypothetical protein